MRIMIIAWYADRRGGADVYTENMAMGLAERGHDVTLVSYEASEEVKLRCKHIQVRRPDYSRWKIVWRFDAWLLKRYWTRQLAVLSAKDPDVIVFCSPLCFQGVRKRFPQVPRVYLPHSRIAPLEATEHLSGWIRKLISFRTYYHSEKQSLLNSSLTVRFTNASAKYLSSYYQMKSVRYEIIPQAINEPFISSIRRSGPTRIVNVSRLIPSKNIRFLLECLEEKIPGEWHVDIIGEGLLREELEKYISSHGLQNYVTLHGHLQDPSPYYAEADLLAFPSKIENVSIVVLEAMSFGTPALVIRQDQQEYHNVHHEVIQHGVDGFIAANEADFKIRLRQLLMEPKPCREMRDAAQRRALLHVWPHALDKWESMFSNLVSWNNSRGIQDKSKHEYCRKMNDVECTESQCQNCVVVETPN